MEHSSVNGIKSINVEYYIMKIVLELPRWA